MLRRIHPRSLLPHLNLRLVLLLLLIAYGVYAQLNKEHVPTLLRPGVHMNAYVTNVADGTVSIVDLVKLATVATIPVGPAPSGVRAHPTRDEIWGVSTDGGFVWIIDARSAGITPAPSPHRIPIGAQPFALDFSPDGARAYIAAAGADKLFVIDCASQKIVGSARTGHRPWTARVTPNGKYVLVPNRDDSTVSILDAATLATLATVPVAPHPEAIEVLPDNSKAFVSAAGTVNPTEARNLSSAAVSAANLSSNGDSAPKPAFSRGPQISVIDLKQFALLTNLPLAPSAQSLAPASLALKPDGGELYVPSPATNGLAILNTWTNEVTEHIIIGDAPSRAVLTSDPEDPFLFVTDSGAGRILPIQINIRRVLKPISVGRHPGVARLTPGRAGVGGEDMLLVVNEDSDDLAVIRVRTQSLLTRDSSTQSLLTMIPVGHHPRDLAVKVF